MRPTDSRYMQTRKKMIEEAIARGNVEELLRYAEGYPCACIGARDGEAECICRMNSKQVRASISLAALRRGKLVRTRRRMDGRAICKR